MQRPLLTAFSTAFLAFACGPGSGEIALEAPENETGLEESDTDTDTDTDTGVGPGIDPEILGEWKHSFEVEGETIRVRWKAEESGDCEIRIPSDQDRWSCSFSAQNGAFEITDDACGPIVGEYTYTIGDDVLTFEPQQDGCSDRELGLSGEWTRAE